MLASFWPKGDLDNLPVMGLALGEYTVSILSKSIQYARMQSQLVFSNLMYDSSHTLAHPLTLICSLFSSTVVSTVGMDFLHHLVVHSGYFEGSHTRRS
jgi:hypothetical protein